MPKLISDARYRKLLEAQKELTILKGVPKESKIESKQLEAINSRLEMLELAVVQLAKILNPTVQTVEDALGTAARFGGVAKK